MGRASVRSVLNGSKPITKTALPATKLEQRVSQLEGEIKDLKEEQWLLYNTVQPIGPVTITMTNYKQYQDDDEDWFSPPFYTHPHGYKMCLCVWSKGAGDGEGTHLSVSFHMMRGKFDDQLKWPFRGDITFQLVDQEEEKDQLRMVLKFSDDTTEQFTKRVTEVEGNTDGWGVPKLLPLSDLQPKYLKNDCIKLRIIKVDLPQ